MIKYRLRCDDGHAFEGWFNSMADYDRQAADGALECPSCGANSVHKAIMAPAIATGESRSARLEQIRATMADAARRARDYVEKNYDYVGERFPEEARAIHYGETEERLIYGEASGAEVRNLLEEGIAVAPVPGAASEAEPQPGQPALTAEPAVSGTGSAESNPGPQSGLKSGPRSGPRSLANARAKSRPKSTLN